MVFWAIFAVEALQQIFWNILCNNTQYVTQVWTVVIFQHWNRLWKNYYNGLSLENEKMHEMKKFIFRWFLEKNAFIEHMEENVEYLTE